MIQFPFSKIGDVYPKCTVEMTRLFLKDYLADVDFYLNTTNRSHYSFREMFAYTPPAFDINVDDIVISASLFFKAPGFNKRNDHPIRDSAGQIPLSVLESTQHPIFEGTHRQNKSFLENYIWPLVSGSWAPCKCIIFLAADLLCLKPILEEHGVNVIVMKHSSVAHNPGSMWRYIAFNFNCRAVYIADSDRKFEMHWINELLKLLEEDPKTALARPLQSTGPGGQMALILGNNFMIKPAQIDFNAAESMLGYIALNILSEDRPTNFVHENLHGRKYFQPRLTNPDYCGPTPGERVPFKCFPYYGFDEMWLKEVIYYHFSNGRTATKLQRLNTSDLIQSLDLKHQRENGNRLV